MSFTQRVAPIGPATNLPLQDSITFEDDGSPTNEDRMIENVADEADIAPKKPTKLTPGDDRKMLELIEAVPRVTLNAIRAQLGVEEMIDRAGASVWLLPPYSPDLNPIEKLWSKVKAWLRRAASDALDTLARAAGDTFRAVTPTECANYFQSCGYTTK